MASFPQKKMIYFGFKKYTHVYYCLRIKEGRGKEKTTILGRNCMYLELSTLKHLKKTCLFCGMTFLLIWGVFLLTFKHTKKLRELKNCTVNVPITHPYSTIYVLLYLLYHISTCTSISLSLNPS